MWYKSSIQRCSKRKRLVYSEMVSHLIIIYETHVAICAKNNK